MKKLNYRLVGGLLVLGSLGVLNFKYAHDGYGVQLLDKVQAQKITDVVTTILTSSGLLPVNARLLKEEKPIERTFDCTTKTTRYYQFRNTGKGKERFCVGSKIVKCGKLQPGEYSGPFDESEVEITGSGVKKFDIYCIGLGAICYEKHWNQEEACGPLCY